MVAWTFAGTQTALPWQLRRTRSAGTSRRGQLLVACAIVSCQLLPNIRYVVAPLLVI